MGNIVRKVKKEWRFVRAGVVFDIIHCFIGNYLCHFIILPNNRWIPGSNLLSLHHKLAGWSATRRYLFMGYFISGFTTVKIVVFDKKARVVPDVGDHSEIVVETHL
tara:strand:- start:3520 stop:3837 length:318 start_codon:yes stop_codon:yes gene_type:complete